MPTIYTSCFCLRWDFPCSYKWCSTRLIFPCINDPNVTEKLDYRSVALGQRLVLAVVVNSSDWDTWSRAVLQWLGQRDTENQETLQQCIEHSSWQLVWHSEGHIGRVETVGRLQQWSGHHVPQLKLQWPGQPTASWDNFIAVIRAGCPGGTPIWKGQGCS